jgi:hypothetical protein
MWRTLPATGLFITGLLSIVVGLAWFFTPYIIEDGSGAIIIEYPNSRGLPFMFLAAGLWVVAALILQRELERKAPSQRT